MPEPSHIDPRSAALGVMDYQVDTLTKFMTAAQSADAIAYVPDLAEACRPTPCRPILRTNPVAPCRRPSSAATHRA
jgi:hypothetical protein